MTNVMKAKPLAAIHERAITFVSQCAEAGKRSVDVYVLLHCYAVDCVTHFMFSPGGLKSLNIQKDFEIMQELTYHQSLQSECSSTDNNAWIQLILTELREPSGVLPPCTSTILPQDSPPTSIP
jgi:hypothetical protein